MFPSSANKMEYKARSMFAFCWKTKIENSSTAFVKILEKRRGKALCKYESNSSVNSIS